MRKKIISALLAVCLVFPLFFTEGAGLGVNALTAGIKTQTVAAGGYHSLIIRQDGSLWASGDNDYGQLGDGTTTARPVPVKVLTGVKSVAAGEEHSAAILKNGDLMVWGGNEYGQLGNGKFAKSTKPIRVMQNVIAVTASESGTFAIQEDGTLWGWGDNESAQLGDGTLRYRNKPVKIMENVVKVVASSQFTMAIKTDGSLWAWGYRVWECIDYDVYGQSDLSAKAKSYNTAVTSSLSSNSSSSGWDDDWEDDEDSYYYATSPEKINTKVADIAIGISHIAMVRTDGKLYTWGGNEFGQLGFGEPGYGKDWEYEDWGGVADPTYVMSGVTAVAAGGFTTYAVKGGALYAFGFNISGLLGDGTTTSRAKPEQVPGMTNVTGVSNSWEHVLAVQKDGSVWGWGANMYGQLGNGQAGEVKTPIQIPTVDAMDPTNIDFVSAGSLHTAAIDKNGVLWTWGGNSVGQLGNGKTVSSEIPIKVMEDVAYVSAGSDYTMAVKKDKTLWGWGGNAGGQLATGDKKDQITPVQITGINEKIASVAAGDTVTLIVTDDGKLYSCGDGDGLTCVTDLVTGMGAIKMAAVGDEYFMALGTDGRLWGWGDNSYGQLGFTSTSYTVNLPRVVMSDVANVVASYVVTIAVKTNGELWGWGNGESGLLGRPTDADEDGEYYDFIVKPTKFMDNASTAPYAVALTYSNIAVVDAAGQVWGWGDNDWGYVGNGGQDMQYTPVKLKDLTDVKMVTARGYHTMALKNNGTLWGWGLNVYGQLGNGVSSIIKKPLQLLGTAKQSESLKLATVSSISIAHKPAKVKYYKGDALNLKGGTITVKYSTGLKGMIPMSAAKVTGYKKNTLGSQKLTVTYKGKTTTFTIKVVKRPVKPVKTEAKVKQYVVLRRDKTRAILNGKKTKIDDVGTKPQIMSGRTMVPVRFVSQKMGAKVKYVGDDKPITVTYGKIKVELRLKAKTMKVTTGKKVKTIKLDVAAQKINGKTFIPLRAIGNALGFSVYFQDGTELITVSTSKPTNSQRAAWLKAGKSYITK